MLARELGVSAVGETIEHLDPSGSWYRPPRSIETKAWTGVARPIQPISSKMQSSAMKDKGL